MLYLNIYSKESRERNEEIKAKRNTFLTASNVVVEKFSFLNTVNNLLSTISIFLTFMNTFFW